jgi:hypothetical protein
MLFRSVLHIASCHICCVHQSAGGRNIHLLSWVGPSRSARLVPASCVQADCQGFPVVADSVVWRVRVRKLGPCKTRRSWGHTLGKL